MRSLVLVVSLLVAIFIVAGNQHPSAGAQPNPPRNFVNYLVCLDSAPSVEASFSIPGRGQTEAILRSRGEGSRLDETWVDLSLSNNGFIDGTFLGSGPILPTDRDSATGYVWAGLMPGRAHFYRLNARIGDRWHEIGTGTFVTPDCRVIEALACDGEQSPASAYFDLSGEVPIALGHSPTAPRTPAALGWIDLSTIDNGFLPGTYLSAGPILTLLVDPYYVWSNLKGATTHYVRFNLLREDGTWLVTPPGGATFVTLDCTDMPEWNVFG